MPLVAPIPRARASLVVVRHGSTSWSREGRHTGRSDVALDEQGKAEAEQLAGLLSGHDFARVLTSPLRRALLTASLAGYGSRAEACEDLREWDYGDYEGRTTEEIRARRPGWVLWRDGVEGGETIEELSRRADRVIALARSSPGDTLAFAHGHVLRVVCARWIGLPGRAGEHFALYPASVGVLGWERESPVVSAWNESCARPLE